MIKKILFLFLILLFSSSLAFSKEKTDKRRGKTTEPVSKTEKTHKKKTGLWELSLKECLVLTLRNNLNIKIEGYNPKIMDTEIDRAMAGESTGSPGFDPILKASFQFTSLRNPSYIDAGSFFLGINGSAGDIVVDKIRTFALSLSLEQRFITGTSYVLAYNHNYRKTERSFGLNPQFQPSVSLTINQPLLKGLGAVANETEILVAKNNRLISGETFKLQLIQIVQDTENRYWDVVQAYQNLELKKKSFQVAKELLHIAQLKHQIGTVPAIEVTAAQSALASRKAEVIDAKNQWKNASDQLASLFLHPQKLRTFQKTLLPTDVPRIPPGDIPLGETISLALKNRAELTQIKVELSTRDMVLKQTSHNLLPQLNLSGTFTLNGMGGDFPDSFRFMRPKKFYDWQVGVVFSYPLFQRSAKSQYRKALLEKKQSSLKFLTSKRDIFLQVRIALRNLITAKQAFLARQEASKFALEKLEGEKTRYSVGKSTNHKVFQIEEEYTGAKTSEIDAKIAIVKAQLALDVATGVLLKNHQIYINDLLSK